MIIHQPEITTKNGYSTVFSRFELKKKSGFFPDFVWYRVPESHGDFLTSQSDAFLIPGMLAGIYFQEEIEVRGPVSPRLAYNLAEYQHLLQIRLPQYVNPVVINYAQLKPMPVRPGGVGTTFSGGVDSLFTIWKHLPQNQPIPDHRVTHSIFIQGFDLLPNEEEHYQFLYERYIQAAQEIGIDLIPLKTNIVSIIHQRLRLTFFNGPIIIGAGHALAAGLGRYITSSSWDYKKLQKTANSFDPQMDHFLSTDTLDVIHHGSTYQRVEKVKEISDWGPAQKVLWVCEVHGFKKDTWNCSRCEKCCRSMIPLYALGKLDQFKGFEKPFRTDRDVLWWARKYSAERVFTKEIFPFVKEHKPDWLPWLRAGAALGTLRWLTLKLMPVFVKKWLRRFGYFVNRNEAMDAYENPAITQIIKEYHDHSPA